MTQVKEPKIVITRPMQRVIELMSQGFDLYVPVTEIRDIARVELRRQGALSVVKTSYATVNALCKRGLLAEKRKETADVIYTLSDKARTLIAESSSDQK